MYERAQLTPIYSKFNFLLPTILVLRFTHKHWAKYKLFNIRLDKARNSIIFHKVLLLGDVHNIYLNNCADHLTIFI